MDDEGVWGCFVDPVKSLGRKVRKGGHHPHHDLQETFATISTRQLCFSCPQKFRTTNIGKINEPWLILFFFLPIPSSSQQKHASNS